ncbi:MAG TPA: hypothetical protein VLB29_02985 [Nocardioidaceae bacterium]|nr:hypothetical protein [Nocardioidaceae bacterium]
MNPHKTVFRRLATVSALSGLGAVALMGAAAADTSVFQDASGDLSHGADIRRVRVVNGDQVKVKVVHDDLVRSYKSGSSIAVFIDTDRTRKGPEFVFLGGTFEGADYALLKADGWKRANDRQVPLNGGTYDMKLDYAKDTATIRIDRKVLRNPGAVRVEVKTGGELVPAGDEPATTGVDWLGKRRDFTPWVKRG